MQGRRALAAILTSAALAGCGTEPRTEPASIQIIGPASGAPAPREVAAPARPSRIGRTRSGSFETAQIVQTPETRSPAIAGAPAAAPVRRRAAGKASFARFRKAQLRVLRAHCATRPEDDPRCDGDDVDERVAFAAYDEAAR